MLGVCKQTFTVNRKNWLYSHKLSPCTLSQACHSYFKYTAYWTKIISPPQKPIPELTSSKYLGKTGKGRGGWWYEQGCGGTGNNDGR